MKLPARFGDYELMAPLARGGMAEVFVGRRLDGTGPSSLCIKRILPAFMQDEEFRSMFTDEARLGSMLKHDNIVEVFDHGNVDGRLYIAMELVTGVTLRKLSQVLARSDAFLEIEDAVAIAVELCSALHYAHTLVAFGRPQEIVHRDVTPGNVLITLDGRPKLMDFGIARAAERITHTLPGLTKGKGPYMSPEQARAIDLDHRSDQFALGILLWESLVGMSLFDEQDGVGLVLSRVAKKEAAPPSTLREGVSEALDAVVLRALQKDRDARFADMQAFGAALKETINTTDHDARFARIADLVLDAHDDMDAPTLKIARDSVSSSSSSSSSDGDGPEIPASDVADTTSKSKAVDASTGSSAAFDDVGPTVPDQRAFPRRVTLPGQPTHDSSSSPQQVRAVPPRPASSSRPAGAPRPRTPTGVGGQAPASEESRAPVLIAAAIAAVLLLAVLGAIAAVWVRGDAPEPVRLEVGVAPAAGACGTPPANEATQMSATSLVWRAEDAARAGDHAAAASLAQEALDVASIPAAHLVLGRAYAELGERGKARTSYECAIEVGAGSADGKVAKTALARLDEPAGARDPGPPSGLPPSSPPSMRTLRCRRCRRRTSPPGSSCPTMMRRR